MKKLSPRTLALIVLLLAAAGFVLSNRLGGSASTGGTVATVTDSSTVGSQPATAESGPAEPQQSQGHAGDDGSDDAPPVLVQPTERPDVKEAATQFAAAWLNAYGQSAQQWRDGLTERMTADLAEEMAIADPESVPAGAKVGDVKTTVQGALLGADAAIVTDAAKPRTVGTLRLTLVEKGGRWLVTEIDWLEDK